MTIRIREGTVTAVLLDHWHKVKLGTFQLDRIDFLGRPVHPSNAVVDESLDDGFTFESADENTVISGPWRSVKAVKMVSDE